MAVKRKVLVAAAPLASRDTPYFARLEQAGLELIRNPLGRTYSEGELIAALPGILATIAGGEPYTERVFRAATDLRVVARFGVGYDGIDVGAATRRGVFIAMAFGTNHHAVADYTFALMAALARNVVGYHQRVKGGGWGWEFRPGLWRSTVGIVGLGRIGKAVARRCRGFEMQILAYDTQPDVAFTRESGVTLVPLETLLREADFVTLHTPHAPETESLMSRDRLALMKPTAFLINTARGGLVDEEALYEALVSGRLAGAGLDVFRREPPSGSPLLALDNVVLGPHAAGSDLTAEAAMGHRCADSVLAVARGESPGPESLLNPEAARARQGRMPLAGA